MPYLITAPGVSFGLTQGRAIFLDIRRDRYATLLSDLTEALLGALSERGEVAADDPLTRRLAATGLFALSAQPGVIALTTHRPPGEGLLDEGARLRFGTAWAEVLAQVIRSRRRVHRLPLHALLPPPEARVTPLASSARDGLRQWTRRFLQARAFIPTAPACLPDSIALRAWLARRGFATRLVLAVRLEPFEAHCWLEGQGLVLNDAPEKIASFAPVGIFP